MKRREFWLCVLCALLFAQLVSWFYAGPDSPLCLIEPEHNEQAPDDNKNYCPTFFAGSLLLSERGFEWIKRDDNDKAVVAAFTIVLGISTIGLWLATINLWKAGERQLEVLSATAFAQSRDMQDSIAVARQSAEAAQKSAEVAERALNSTEKAFVFLKYMYASPIYGIGGVINGWDFHVVWENSGSTPTQFMVSRKNWMFFEGPIPEDFDFPDLGNPTHQSKSFMGPKAIVDAGALQVGNDVLEKVAKGPARLLMYGWAEYNDVFSPRIRHRSEFCSEIGVNGSLSTPPDDKIKPPFVFQVYKRHNGTGEECYRKPITTGFS
jgi:hypothetical protein